MKEIEDGFYKLAKFIPKIIFIVWNLVTSILWIFGKIDFSEFVFYFFIAVGVSLALFLILAGTFFRVTNFSKDTKGIKEVFFSKKKK